MKTKYRKLLIFVQSSIALVGSLYYSSFGDPLPDLLTGTLFAGPGLSPCTLCRWARVCMYPLVLFSGLSLIYNEENTRKYILPLAGIGLLINTYHYILQKFPIQTFQTCTFDKPCDALTVEYFGFLTIPLLSRIAFAVIIVACVMRKKALSKKTELT